MYSRRPTSMPTWASADRTVQRGCEPKAINPLQGEKRERGRFLVRCDIGTKRDLFNNRAHLLLRATGGEAERLFVAQIGCGFGAERTPGAGKAERQGQQGCEPHRPQQWTR